MDVEISCLCAYDPPMVNIKVGPLPDGGYYSFQVPEPYYKTISGPLNYPPDPCDDC